MAEVSVDAIAILQFMEDMLLEIPGEGERIVIDRERCGHCGSCVSVCAPMAIVLLDTFVMVDLGVCTGCLDCVYACPVGAIEGR